MESDQPSSYGDDVAGDQSRGSHLAADSTEGFGATMNGDSPLATPARSLPASTEPLQIAAESPQVQLKSHFSSDSPSVDVSDASLSRLVVPNGASQAKMRSKSAMPLRGTKRQRTPPGSAFGGAASEESSELSRQVEHNTHKRLQTCNSWAGPVTEWTPVIGEFAAEDEEVQQLPEAADPVHTTPVHQRIRFEQLSDDGRSPTRLLAWWLHCASIDAASSHHSSPTRASEPFPPAPPNTRESHPRPQRWPRIIGGAQSWASFEPIMERSEDERSASPTPCRCPPSCDRPRALVFRDVPPSGEFTFRPPSFSSGVGLFGGARSSVSSLVLGSASPGSVYDDDIARTESVFGSDVSTAGDPDEVVWTIHPNQPISTASITVQDGADIEASSSLGSGGDEAESETSLVGSDGSRVVQIIPIRQVAPAWPVPDPTLTSPVVLRSRKRPAHFPELRWFETRERKRQRGEWSDSSSGCGGSFISSTIECESDGSFRRPQYRFQAPAMQRMPQLLPSHDTETIVALLAVRAQIRRDEARMAQQRRDYEEAYGEIDEMDLPMTPPNLRPRELAEMTPLLSPRGTRTLLHPRQQQTGMRARRLEDDFDEAHSESDRPATDGLSVNSTSSSPTPLAQVRERLRSLDLDRIWGPSFRPWSPRG